jgi:hypothetical protein
MLVYIIPADHAGMPKAHEPHKTNAITARIGRNLRGYFIDYLLGYSRLRKPNILSIYQSAP